VDEEKAVLDILADILDADSARFLEDLIEETT